jgi:hypothetical protein
LRKLSNYSFEISTVGWINCDRYLKQAKRLSELAIHVGEGYDASQFVSMLIYPRLPTIGGGNYTGGKIHLRNLIVNEPVQLVCLGVKDDKVVSAITSFTVGQGEPPTPVFEEITPEAFRQKLKILMSSPR